MLLFQLGVTTGAIAMFITLAVVARALAKRDARFHGQNSTEPVEERVLAVIGQGEKRHVVTNKR